MRSPITTAEYLDLMEVRLASGMLDGLIVEKFTVDEDDITGVAERIRAAMIGRDIPPGTYTRLLDKRAVRELVMSDTIAERADHIVAVQKMARLSARRVLINGLGLGMVLSAAIRLGYARHIDVVEIDPRVIELVGTQYLAPAEEAGIELEIHEADAVEQMAAWPPGTRWDVGWTDIWPSLSTDSLSEIFAFRASYNRRCQWHDCWGRGILLDLRRRGI